MAVTIKQRDRMQFFVEVAGFGKGDTGHMSILGKTEGDKLGGGKNTNFWCQIDWVFAVEDSVGCLDVSGRVFTCQISC